MLSVIKNPISIDRQKIRRRTSWVSKKRVKSLELQVSTKLEVIRCKLKLRVENYELNLELQFSKTLKPPAAKFF